MSSRKTPRAGQLSETHLEAIKSLSASPNARRSLGGTYEHESLAARRVRGHASMRGLQPAPNDSSRSPQTSEGRRLGVLLGSGFEAEILSALEEAASGAGASLEFIGPILGAVIGSDDGTVEPAGTVRDAAPERYDAVVVLPGNGDTSGLARNPAAQHFVGEVRRQAKLIGYAGSARGLLDAMGLDDATGVELEGGFVELESGTDARMFVEQCRALRFWNREASFD